MKPPPRLDERFGVVRANTTVLAAGLMAAHAAAASSGFRPSDVRFFVYLFSNWLERDVLYPGEALDLTQIRRVLLRLVRLGWAEKAAGAAGKGSGTRYGLTGEGFSALVAALVAAVDSRSFEEAVFVVSFVAGYRLRLVELLAAESSDGWHEQLDARRLLLRARRRVERVLADLTERVASSACVAREAAALRRAGVADAALAQKLEALGVYQLQHVRPLSAFVLSFPPLLREFELGPAFEHRSRFLFETFADATRGQLRALEKLEARLAEDEWAGDSSSSRVDRDRQT